MQGIAKQSNAASPLCGFVESFWIKRSAVQRIARQGVAWQGIAMHRNETRAASWQQDAVRVPVELKCIVLSTLPDKHASSCCSVHTAV
jgi:hypothetical protein